MEVYRWREAAGAACTAVIVREAEQVMAVSVSESVAGRSRRSLDGWERPL